MHNMLLPYTIVHEEENEAGTSCIEHNTDKAVLNKVKLMK